MFEPLINASISLATALIGGIGTLVGLAVLVVIIDKIITRPRRGRKKNTQNQRE